MDATHARKAPLSPRELRYFGLLMAGFVCLFFGLVIPWLWSRDTPAWPWAVAAAFAALALAAPRVLTPVHRAWMRFGLVLGAINTRIILGVVYFLVFAPAAIVFRALGKDLLARRWLADAKTYRVKKPARDPGAEMERPY